LIFSPFLLITLRVNNYFEIAKTRKIMTQTD